MEFFIDFIFYISFQFSLLNKYYRRDCEVRRRLDFGNPGVLGNNKHSWFRAHHGNHR